MFLLVEVEVEATAVEVAVAVVLELQQVIPLQLILLQDIQLP